MRSCTRWLRAAIAGSALLVACEIAPHSTGPASGPIVQIVVSPDSITLDPTQTTQFRAYGRTQSGDSVPAPTRWSASGGSITTGGLYTADTIPGDFQVTATATSSPATGSSRVKNRGPLSQVILSPHTASVVAGGALQYAAYGKRKNGDSVAVDVNYAATGGTISASGLYAAGQSAGTYRAIATQNGGALADTAAVTITTVPVGSVAVSPAAASVPVGQTVQLTATPKDVSGNPVSGRVVTWATSNALLATVSASGVVTGVAAGSIIITATSEGQNGTATIAVTAAVTNPGTVSDLAVSGVTDTSVTLAFTEVNDGTGQPASYDIRYAVGPLSWGSAASVGRGTCATPVAGSAIGAQRSCTVLGLAAGTGYQFQLVAFRGTLNVNAVFGALSNPASGTTSAPAGVLVASVTVSPASASLAVGQTVQLVATPKDAVGNPLSGRVVTWATSNALLATVNGSGLVTGVAAGSVTITATSEGKSGTAAVTVSASTGGGTILFQESFEDAAFGSRGWYDNSGMGTTTAQHISGSNSALEAHFLVGATTPTWGPGARHLFTPTGSVYLSYWVKYSANWVGSGQPYHPHEFLFMTTEEAAYAGPAFTHLTTYVEHNYQNGGIPVLTMQDGSNIDQSRIGVDLTAVTENRAAAGCNGNTDGYPTDCYLGGPGQYWNGKTWKAAQPAFLPAPGPGYKGDWHFVEAYFQLNSIQNGKGVSDGIVRYWFDGQLVIEHTNVLLRTGAHPTMQFNQFLLAPYIGAGSPVDQTMWVDNLTVAAGRP